MVGQAPPSTAARGGGGKPRLSGDSRSSLSARQGARPDPDGLLAEAEYDMGVVMREDGLQPGGSQMLAVADQVTG